MMMMVSGQKAAAVTAGASRRMLLSSSSVSRFAYRNFRSSTKVATGGGAGYGNVQDRMIAREHLYQHTDDPHTVSIIGAPMTYGQPYVGTDSGPLLLRKGGLLNKLTSLGWRVEDSPDLDFDSLTHTTTASSSSSSSLPPSWNAKNAEIVGQGCEQLSEIVCEKIKQGRFPLILGGDHSIGIGSLAGILQARPDTGFIWVDAHADLNTPAISESGNMHGMPIGMLVNYERNAPENERVPGFDWLDNVPKMRPDQLVYIGLRDVDEAEREVIRNMGIAAYTMHEIDRYGIGKVMDMALDHLCGDSSNYPNRPLHLSYDIDAVDPILAPATGTRVRGGLTYREAHYVAEAVAYTGNLASAEIVELNPSLSHAEGAEETVDLGLQIITSFMGKSII